jgi:Rrf2 family protein
MFNKETEYALRGLVYIQIQNLKDRKPGVDEISRETAAPRFFVAKILHRLVRAGFLNSLKGKGGGFFFEAKKSSPRIKDLVTAIEGDRVISGCVFGLAKCDSENPCPMHERYAPVRDAIENLFTSETILSLAGKYVTTDKKVIYKDLPLN